MTFKRLTAFALSMLAVLTLSSSADAATIKKTARRAKPAHVTSGATTKKPTAASAAKTRTAKATKTAKTKKRVTAGKAAKGKGAKKRSTKSKAKSLSRAQAQS